MVAVIQADQSTDDDQHGYRHVNGDSDGLGIKEVGQHQKQGDEYGDVIIPLLPQLD